MSKKLKEISIIIPCYNEDENVLKNTIKELQYSLQNTDVLHEIIVVNDGSEMEYNLNSYDNVILVNHEKNKGYGAALKSGIRASSHQWIGITDSDGTYPNDSFHILIENSSGLDMVVGARKWSHIKGLRKIPKKILTAFAKFLTGMDIPDLNSGMRIFKKELALQFWHLFPSGFSFTSTITIGALTNDFKVSFVEIDYFKRVGKSSISPFKDTLLFFTLVTRLAMYFNPKKVFIPVSFLVLILALLRSVRDYIVTGGLGGVSLILFFISFQVFFFGLIAEIINVTRHYIIYNRNDDK